MNFVGEARKATPAEIDATAHSLGVEPAVFRSVISVEAGGSGFDKAKRPKALFERHVFYRQFMMPPACEPMQCLKIKRFHQFLQNTI